MAGCDDTRQLTEAQRQAGYQGQRTGVPRAIRPFSGRPTIENLIDYINRELQPAVRQTRDRVNDIYLPVADNAPSANPLGYYFSTETANADPTSGRIRLNAATQDTATVIRVSETNGRLADAAPWLDVMSGGATSPLGVVTLCDAVNPARFIRFDLSSMADAGAYWNLTVVPVESSHDNPFVEGEPVSISFIPGVGGLTPATVAGSSIGGATGRRQFLSTSTGTAVDFRTLSAIYPGAPIYDVMAHPFNATGNGVADDTVAINAAIAAANAAPGIVYLAKAHRITAALTAITGNNVILQGRGPFNGGTNLIIDSASAIVAITLQSQYSAVRDVWISGARVYTGGCAIKIVDCYHAFVEHVLVSQQYLAVEALRSTNTDLYRVYFDDLYGPRGIYAHGDATAYNHAIRMYNCFAGTNYPGSVVGVGGTWAAGQTIAIGNIRFSNGAIYQAVSAGTTGATAPTGIPGSTTATAHTATFNDGGVLWVFAMPLTTWFCQGSYSHTFELYNCGALQGGYGASMEDDAPGANSTPLFMRIDNFQVDHPFARGLRLRQGKAVEITQLFITSVQEGYGLEVASTFGGGWRVVGGEIFGCARANVLISKGDGILADMQIAGGGSGYSTIEVTNSASNWKVQGCIAGATVDSAVPVTSYGIDIAAGSDNYTVEGNTFVGHVTAPIRNTPGVSTTRIVRNNIPEWANYDAPDGWEVFTLAAGTHTLTLLATTHTVFVIALGAVIINKIVHGAGNIGRIVTIIKEGSTNTVAIRDSNADIDCIWTPGSSDYVLSAYNDAARLEHKAELRWRLVSGARQVALTDGDKGDITVSSNGTVWNIDANVVGDGELRQGIACSVIGRSANSTGNVADIQGGTNDRVLARATNTLSFQQVSTGMIADSAVTDAKLRNGQGNSVIGRSVNSTGVVADIVCVAGTHGVLRENGSGTLAFGKVRNEGLNDMAQSRIKGRESGAGTGEPSDLTPTQTVDIIEAELETRVMSWSNGPQNFLAGIYNSNVYQFDGILTTATTAANNLAIGAVNVVRFTGPVDPLTGMVPSSQSQLVLLINAHASADMGILIENASSTANNRFAGVGTSRVIKAGEMALAWHDNASNRWRLLCRDEVDL